MTLLKSKRTQVLLAGLLVISYLYFFKQIYLSSIPESPLVNPVLPVLPELVGYSLPPVPNAAFQVGEELHYGIVYKGITVGHATLAVKEGPLVNGRPTFQLESIAESNSFFDHFFKVRDNNSSIVDKESLFSLGFQQNLREGQYRATRKYDFDYKAKKFQALETNKGKESRDSGLLSEPVHDILSAFFYCRARSLNSGQDFSLPIYRNGRVMKLQVKINSELKKIESPAGTYECRLVEPLVKGDSLFGSKDGRLLVWMTNDSKKIPVLIEATASVGVVRVRLLKKLSISDK